MCARPPGLHRYCKLAKLSLKQEEKDWLQKTCPYLDEDYLEYLKSYRFKPEQVEIIFVPSEQDAHRGQIEMTATGPWLETILWEIPLMALLSETYFLVVETAWRRENQEEKAYEKGMKLFQEGCILSEFGTRRRRSFKTQDDVVAGLIRANAAAASQSKGGRLFGTSNVHLSHKYGLNPIGTMGHEWFMATAAVQGYQGSTIRAVSLSESVYSLEKASNLYDSLTDTFPTDVFFREFWQDPDLVKRWRLRQDSGDPLEYVKKERALYESLSIDVRGRLIVFSDSLNIDKVLKIKKACDTAGIQPSFGIGTFLTNDFVKEDGIEPSEPLIMVIKLASINGVPCVKISDELSKNTGDPAAVNHVKGIFGSPSA